MGRGADLKKRVVVAHLKAIERRLRDLSVLVRHPPPLLTVEGEILASHAAILSALATLERGEV